MPNMQDPDLSTHVLSRSAERRQALETLKLAQKLADLSQHKRQALSLPAHIEAEIVHLEKIKTHGAHKRQLAYIAKILRREDADTLAHLQHELDKDSLSHQQQLAKQRRITHMAEQLVAGDDDLFGQLCEDYPALDRQHLRTLIRNAGKASRQDTHGKPRIQPLLALLQKLDSA